mgnify:CR=1 FL=1
MEEGKTTATLVEKSVDGVGQVKTIVTKTWSRMSFRNRCLAALYATFTVGNMAFLTYRDSKQYLNSWYDYRRNSGDLGEHELKTPFDAAKYGANMNFWENTWSSICFPGTMVSNLSPHLVVWFNPDKSEESEE